MKIKCRNPNHKDTTPSLHIYSDRAFCFVCGYSCPSEEVADPEELKIIKRDPDNIQERMEYIRSLPILKIRGLMLRTDSQGFYIVWPNGEFYKRRNSAGKSRYTGPRGHKPPLFEWRKSGGKLIVIEGELNALSLLEAGIQEYSVASPGSATELSTHLSKYLTYKEICVIVDRDAAGVAYGLQLKSELLHHGKKVTLNAVEKDANQILQEEGIEGVRAWFRSLDLP